MDSQAKLTDWANLPENVKEVSLWSTLHDGELCAVRSDLLARTVTLDFDVDYVREFNHLPKGTHFFMVLKGVQSVRASRSERWPGEFFVPKGTPREQESSLIAEFHSKWREESQAWAEFEQLIAGSDTLDATLVQSDVAVAVKLGVMANEHYYQAHIRAEAVTFSVGDRQLSIEEFAALGEAYWKAFSDRRLR